MSHLDLILPVCALVLVVCLIFKVRQLLDNMVADLKETSRPIKVLLRIAAILLVLLSGAASGYAAFWLTMGIFWHLFTS